MEVDGHTADYLYKELWWKFHTVRELGHSRNGDVWNFPAPVFITLYEPQNRVLFNPRRDCNPFFHIAETVWMLAGSNDVRFVEKFNSRYGEYADRDKVWGAYGHRWLRSFDQIQQVISMLNHDKETRRAVIAMWDADSDLGAEKKDLPCNTHIYFRIRSGRLNMTVCNRSNDMVWGMMGANIVHFTFLQELISCATGVPLGNYQVFTNNLHVYPEMPRFEEIYNGGLYGEPQPYPAGERFSILQDGETWRDLHQDCFEYVNMYVKPLRTAWFKNVAFPMMEAYTDKDHRENWVEKVKAVDWRQAALAWMARRV